MPDVYDWIGNSAIIDEITVVGGVDDFQLVAYRISQRPSTITVNREGSGNLSEQIVRIEPYNIPREDVDSSSGNVATSLQQIIVLGYKNHPTIDDTDLQRRDRFYYQDNMFDVITLIDQYQDRILAVAEIRE